MRQAQVDMGFGVVVRRIHKDFHERAWDPVDTTNLHTPFMSSSPSISALNNAAVMRTTHWGFHLSPK